MIDIVKTALARIKGKPEFHAGVTKAVTDDRDDYYGGSSAYSNIPDHIPLYKLVRYANRDLPLALACRANTDLVVGAGYHLTGSNLETKEGQDVLEIIEKFCQHNKFDKLLQRACYDLWVSGNAFFTWKKKDPHALRPIDQSNIVDISVDEDGDPEYYYLYNRTMPSMQYQDTGMQGGHGRLKKMHADQMIHWVFQNHESPFGTGLGQINCRRGEGYKGADGQTYRTKSAVEEREMERDVLSQMLYGAQPRFVVSLEGDDDVLDETYKSMTDLRPNQHIVTAATNMKVDTISNAPSNKFDSILKKSDDAAIIGTMSPYARIWSSSDSFSYASSKTAMASLFPLIDAMARNLKQSVEALFKTVLEKEMPFLDWDQNKVTIHFGSEKGIDLDRIAQLQQILDSPAYEGLYNPESILEMIRNAGLPIEARNPTDPKVMASAKLREKHLHARTFADDNNSSQGIDLDLERARVYKRMNRKGNQADKWQSQGGMSKFNVADDT